MHYVHPATRELGPEYLNDPHTAHALLRDAYPAAPVVMPRGNRAWMITGYEDVRAALADPRLLKDARKLPGGQPGALGSHMLSTDPPDHARLRRLVAAAFTARRVEELRPRITAITTGLLDALEGRESADLVSDFAFPLPVTVICELLGVPPGDRADFGAWTGTVLSSTSPPAAVQAAADAMIGYFTSLIASRRERPADDMISALIQARDSHDRLSEHELTSMLFLLLVAGHETTVNLIASGVLALLTHPPELARLRADPSLLPAAVEELLRFTSPVNHATFRFTGCPVAVGNVLIPEGQTVVAAIASANRDPARFGSPEELDLCRDSGGHLAFGHGIHYCLGAPLARLEAVIAFGSLLSRFGGLALAVPEESLRWRESSLIRGLESLPVLLR
jgi:cytochrome P450